MSAATAPSGQPTYLGGISLNFHLGQMVTVRSGHAGYIQELCYDSESGAPHARVCLVEPVEFPATENFAAATYWWQYVPISELLPADENAVIRRHLCNALVKAETFIAGFEDDESQEGIANLLKEIRAAKSLVRL